MFVMTVKPVNTMVYMWVSVTTTFILQGLGRVAVGSLFQHAEQPIL